MNQFYPSLLIKEDLIKMVTKNIVGKASRHGKVARIPEFVVRIVVNRFLYEINNSFMKLTPVTIRNFGKFKIIRTKARQGRNQFTKKLMVIPPQWKVTFRQSNTIKQLLKRKG